MCGAVGKQKILKDDLANSGAPFLPSPFILYLFLCSPTLQLLASKTAYYIICIRQDDLFKESGKRGGNSFLAKLRATSVAHTEYALYDR